MGSPLIQYDWKPAQPAQVEYVPESQVLFIENGQNSAVDDDFASTSSSTMTMAMSMRPHR